MLRKTRLYNPDKIVSIKIIDRQEDDSYSYKEAKKGFLFGRKAGIYDFWNHGPFDISEINRLLIDGVVYWRPHVRIQFQDQSYHEEEFDTYELATQWVLNKFGKDIYNKYIVL